MARVKRWTTLAACVVAVLGIGVLDIATGPLPDLTVLYLIPIGVATVVAGLWVGLAIAVLTFAVEVTPLMLSGHYPVALVLIDGITHLLVRGLAVVALSSLLLQLKEIRALKAERDFDLELAVRVHESFFAPPQTERPDLEIGQRLKFIREIGGDYAHYAETAEGLFFCVGDISGKGVSAALFTSVLDRAITEALDVSPDVANILKLANERLSAALPDDRFVTLFAAVIGDSGLTYASAGHEPPMLYVAGEEPRIVRLDGAGSLPLGVRPEFEVVPVQRAFSTGDVLLVVTDGVTESQAFFPHADKQLAALVLSAAPLGAQHVTDVVFDAVHATGSSPRDDVLVVAVERKYVDRRTV